MSVELIYETHSITVDNERGIAAGWLPGELSDAGRVGAQALGAGRPGRRALPLAGGLEVQRAGT